MSRFDVVAQLAREIEARRLVRMGNFFGVKKRAIHLRVAEHARATYIDLGDETGACIEVTAKGWRVRDEAPVMFRRPDAMRALPHPEKGGTLDELHPFFNAAAADALHLFVAWMVAAFRPGRPFPILALHGEQGTAKSTASRVARSLVDPNAAPVRSAPRTEDDLAVASVHSHVVAFDNLSGVQPWRAIGTELGISHEQARKDYKLAIEEHNAVAREEHRANADAAVRWVVQKMASGVEAGDTESANVVIRAIALHAKLRGYEAAQEVNIATREVVIHVSQEAAKAFAPPDDERPPLGEQ